MIRLSSLFVFLALWGFSLGALAQDEQHPLGRDFQGGSPLPEPVTKEIIVQVAKVAKEFAEAAYLKKDAKRVEGLAVKERTEGFQAYLDQVLKGEVKADDLEQGPVSAAGSGMEAKMVRAEITLEGMVTQAGAKPAKRKIYVKVRPTAEGYRVCEVEVP